MTKIAAGEAGFYQDLSRLKSVRGSEGLSAAAEGFETMFLQLVLKNMRAGADALADEDNPLASDQQRFYRELYDGQIATALAASGDLGIAGPIVKQLGGMPMAEPLAVAADGGLKKSVEPVALAVQEPAAQEGGGLAAFQQPLRAPAKSANPG